MDASHVYVGAWALGCFHSLISTQKLNLSEGADRVGGQLHGDKECPFSGVTKSGRVWRKVPESDARSVRPVLPVPNKPYGFRGRKATVNNEMLLKGSLFPYYINTNFPCGPFFTF